MNRMLHLFRTHVHQKRIRLTEEFQDDLNWFINFLQICNNKVYFDKREKIHSHEVYVDASLQGLGAVWGERCYATLIPNDIQQNRHLA